MNIKEFTQETLAEVIAALQAAKSKKYEATMYSEIEFDLALGINIDNQLEVSTTGSKIKYSINVEQL